MSDKLDPDWLAREMAEVSSDYAMHFAPGADTVARRAGGVHAPLSDHDAARLRIKMAARYHAWTGRNLAADMRDHPSI